MSNQKKDSNQSHCQLENSTQYNKYHHSSTPGYNLEDKYNSYTKDLTPRNCCDHKKKALVPSLDQKKTESSKGLWRGFWFYQETSRKILDIMTKKVYDWIIQGVSLPKNKKWTEFMDFLVSFTPNIRNAILYVL